MQVLHSEGVILKVIDFHDYDQIMTVFTPERGIVKWIYKKGRPTSAKPQTKISPLVRAEFLYTESKGDIWKCREISIINNYFKLREDYAWLETAGQLIQWILSSQCEHKPAPKLYRLLIAYLEKIPFATNRYALEISFLVYLLKHEGLINFDLYCSLCQRPLQSLYMARGDHFCSVHAPLDALFFDEDETLAWMQIAACQSFSELNKLTIPETLSTKACHLFQNLINH
jgi:DNA repair protein RecO (recombination protein O)